MSNASVIEKFYSAFEAHNAEAMCECYHEEVVFEDPAFGKLKGDEARDMWRMLLERASDLSINFYDINSHQDKGTAKWEAIYTFSQTGRRVHNKIRAQFTFKDDKIINHKDHFDIWKWSSQALGPIGLFLGFTPLVKNKIRQKALKSLQSYRKSKNQ